jgi:acyl-CoA synthetase (AMP-forming)/AMP-acid ligase II
VAIVFTSGTTGVPKGALFRSRQLEAVTRIDLGAIAEEWGGGGPLLASTQFSHIGVMTKLPWYLRTQSCIVALERWQADDVLRTIARHRIGSIGGVAPQIALLLRSPLVDELDLSCVCSLIVGGAMSPPALVREARERFRAPYSIRYSSTESGGVGLGTSFEADDDEALHSIGRPRPGVEVRITQDSELCIRSSAQFSEYWRDPTATAATIDDDGWVHTGDLATIEDDGLVRINGRAKEMYIRGGYNVAPAEVESVLGEHPSVAQVAVAARPDDVMGEVGVAFVVARDGVAAPTLDELRAHGADRLAPWKLPEAVLVVDELPLTPMQKLDRTALARLARLEA